jgi:predicted MFS family arabinose efflux permease
LVGYTSFYLCSDPDHWLVFISISVASFGFYGLLTLGYVLVNLHCGHKARGSVMGINCLFGAIAILILAKGGGTAFDKIDKSVPFLGAAVGSFILLIIVLFTKNSLDSAKPPGCPIDHSNLAIAGSQETSNE